VHRRRSAAGRLGRPPPGARVRRATDRRGSALMRCAWIAALALVGACAHVTAPPAAATADEVAAALSRCVADGEACPALAKRLEARLRVRYDASTAHRLAWRMTETF